MTLASNLFSLSSAPAWAHRFRSDELDEIRAFVARSDGEHSRVANAVGPLGFELSWLTAGFLKLGWGRTAIGQTIRGAVPEATLHLAVPGGSFYRVGRRDFAPPAGGAMFLAPGWEFTRGSPPGAVFGLNINGRQLAQEIGARRATRRDEPVFQTQNLVLTADDHAALTSAATEVALATLPGASVLAGRHAQARMLVLVADLLIRRGAVPRGQDVSAARIAELESWIDEHLDEPLTVGRLCYVAGVGERYLQKAFRSRRGMSPMRFVTERRLAAARKRLTQAGPHDDVTSVAVDLGFGHVGRFAQMYRHAFGEAPSKSLKRGPV